MFPPIAPYQSEFLTVSERHTLYLEQSGNPEGVPVIVLHGGPGGGSWGSTLAMAYGVTHPQQCLGFIIRGIFLMQPAEIAWFLVGTRYFYPDLWDPLMQKLLNACDQSHRSLDELTHHDILTLLDTLLHSGQSELTDAVFQAFGQFEQALMTLLPQDRFSATAEHCKTVAKIEQHFFSHNTHETANLLERLAAVQHLPCIIVQGRYDVVCPPITAYKVHQAWSGSKLVIVPNGGHSAIDPPNAEALLAATAEFKSVLQHVADGHK